jgi:BirA family biotin operon repressor/biotin-[acetyl-CoA-carboxylase] ligase
LEILWFKQLPSTHLYLLEELKNGSLKAPIAVACDSQTNGVGSRGNEWQGYEGNLFLSFALQKDMIANDIPAQSLSIYFAYILKEVLSQFGSKVWVKWPNDFYLENKKCGGVISALKSDTIICSIGLNLIASPKKFSTLDIAINREDLLEIFFQRVEKKILWKHIFSKFEVEFQKSREFGANINDNQVLLKDALLLSDGSVMINNKRVYSLR